MSDQTMDPGFAAADTAIDPMARFSGQASISIAAGLTGLAVGGPVVGALSAAVGAAAASGYAHLAATRHQASEKRAAKSRA